MSLLLAVPMMATCKPIARRVDVSLCGEVDIFPSGDIAWTGDDPYDTSILSPAANGCYHPIEPDKAQKIEDKCLQPLVESRHFKPISMGKTGQKQVPLIQ